MATNNESDNQLVLLGTSDVPERNWEEYLGSNPTLVFHGMKILEITKLEVHDAEYSRPTKKVCNIICRLRTRVSCTESSPN